MDTLEKPTFKDILDACIDPELDDDEEYVFFLRAGDLIQSYQNIHLIQRISQHSNSDQRITLETKIITNYGNTTVVRHYKPDETVYIPIRDEQIWKKIRWVLAPVEGKPQNDLYRFTAEISTTHRWLSAENIFITQMNYVGVEKARNSGLFSLVAPIRRRVPFDRITAAKYGLTDYYDIT